MKLLEAGSSALGGVARPHGHVQLQVITKRKTFVELSLRDIVRLTDPRRASSEEIARFRWANLPNLWRGLWKIQVAKHLGIPTHYGALYLARKQYGQREFEHFGLASLRVVTTAGVNFITDAFQNSVELEILKYHGIGTTNTAENLSDTALAAELTTQYNPDSTRATGSLTEGGGANVFRTVGTNTVDAVVAVVEHGIFSQAATGGGTLLDRSVFSVINLGSGDSLQSTYDFTSTAGS